MKKVKKISAAILAIALTPNINATVVENPDIKVRVEAVRQYLQQNPENLNSSLLASIVEKKQAANIPDDKWDDWGSAWINFNNWTNAFNQQVSM